MTIDTAALRALAAKSSPDCVGLNDAAMTVHDWNLRVAACNALIPLCDEVDRLRAENAALLAALDKVNMAACYGSEEDTSKEARDFVLLHIGETARAALKGGDNAG